MKMSKAYSKTKNQLMKEPLKVENYPTRPSFHPPAQKQNSPAAHFETSREVAALDAQYSDLLRPQEVNYKAHVIPVVVIVAFSLGLAAVLYSKNSSPKEASGYLGRGPTSEELSDLSTGKYQSQSADYQEEKTCIENTDGTKSCTTKTKLRRSFR